MNIELRLLLDDTHSNLFINNGDTPIARIPFDDAFELNGKVILANDGVQVFIIEDPTFIEMFDIKLSESYGLSDGHDNAIIFTDGGAAIAY